MQARKTTHSQDGQHQDVDRTPRGRVNQTDRGQINGESRPTSMVWPTIRWRTAKEQNSATPLLPALGSCFSSTEASQCHQRIPHSVVERCGVLRASYEWMNASSRESHWSFLLALANAFFAHRPSYTTSVKPSRWRSQELAKYRDVERRVRVHE